MTNKPETLKRIISRQMYKNAALSENDRQQRTPKELVSARYQIPLKDLVDLESAYHIENNTGIVDFTYEPDDNNFIQLVRSGTDMNHISRMIDNNEIGNVRIELLAEYAASSGRLDLLQWVHENGYPWDHNTCSKAAEHGHLECLIYARQNGCGWNEQTTLLAAQNGHLNCLEYASENSCPKHDYTGAVAAENGHLECLEHVLNTAGYEWDCATICSGAAKNGQIVCLRYACENNEKPCVFDAFFCLEAIRNGHVNCLEYYFDIHGTVPRPACLLAMANGHLDCLEFAYTHRAGDGIWDQRLANKAYENEHFKCLQYAVNNGCPCTNEQRIIVDALNEADELNNMHGGRLTPSYKNNTLEIVTLIAIILISSIYSY